MAEQHFPTINMHRYFNPVNVFQNLMLVSAISIASGFRSTVYCNGTSVSHHFDTVFNMVILFHGNTVALVEKKSQVKVPDSGVSVSNVTGTLSQGHKYLMAILDVECRETNNIRCQIFGLLQDRKNYKNEIFKPLLTFEVKEPNMSIAKTPDQDYYSMGDVVTVECSTDVGSNLTQWGFNVDCQGVCQSQYDVEKDSITTSTSLSNCVYHTKASINVTVKEEGRIRIRCKLDETEVGSTALESDDNEAILSFHLFLTSLFLVYCPFIIMPSLWCCCPVCSSNWRNPDKATFKYLRSALSVGNSLVFVFWWIAVYIRHGERPGFISYGTFAAIEGVFMFLYALHRFLYKFLDSCFGADHAYNARVTTSHGAVMTPIICWLMIRFPRGLSYSSLEILFWFVAIPSLLTFALVSHRREGADWTSKNK